jgi:hypothetical protein
VCPWLFPDSHSPGSHRGCGVSGRCTSYSRLSPGPVVSQLGSQSP